MLKGVKSDIWSLGLVIHELVFGSNPMLIKYNELKKKYNNEEMIIEKKINDFFKNSNVLEISDNDKRKFYTKSNEEQLFWYKIIKLIEKILITKPDQRLELHQIYWELFQKNIPDFKNSTNQFNYEISCLTQTNRFIKFRKFYYMTINKIMHDNDEIFLYPMLINLFDRFFITLFNSSKILIIPQTINIFEDNNQIDLSMHFLSPENIINYDLENINNSSYQLDHLGIITCTFYVITKIIILKKIIEINLDLYRFNKIFSERFMKDSFPNIFMYLIPNLIFILNKLNWDIPRPKLYFYKNSDKKKVEEIIKIINEFEVEKIIKYIE